MGYIDTDGEYHNVDEPSIFQRLWHPPDIWENSKDYSEIVVTNGAKPVLYGLSSSEIFNTFMSEVSARNNWQTVAEGFISYPVDIGWFGYTLAAAPGALGPIAKDRVSQTWGRARELIGEASGISLTIGTGFIEGAAAEGVAQGGIGTTKLVFAANVVANHLIHGGLLHTVGRMAGGLATRYVLALLITKGFGRWFPPLAVSTQAIANNPRLTRSLMFMTKVGSITRKGDLKIRETGSLQGMGLIDTIVTLMTGESDPKGVNAFIHDMKTSLRDTLSALEREIWSDLLERRLKRPSYYDEPKTDIILRQLGREAGSISIQIMNYNNDEFLDLVIRAHNLSVHLFRQGYQTDPVNRIRTLGDPTFLVWTRAYMASLTSVLGNFLHMPEQGRWWDMMMKEELVRANNLNNPDHILGTQGTTR